MNRVVHAGTGEAALADACRRLGLEALPSAPLAALGVGVSLAPGDLVFHCDLVRVIDGRMAEAPADPPDAEALLLSLRPIAARLVMELRPLAGSRGLLIYREGWPFDLRTHDPATLLGQPVAGRQPYGAGDEVMRDLMESSAAALGAGLQAWPWGGARLPTVRRVEPAGVISGVDPAAAGLARLIGWRFENSG